MLEKMKHTVTPEIWGRSTHTDTELGHGFEVYTGGVTTKIITQILGLRAPFRTQEGFCLTKLMPEMYSVLLRWAGRRFLRIWWRISSYVFDYSSDGAGVRGGGGWTQSGSPWGDYMGISENIGGRGGRAAARHVGPTGNLMEPLPPGCRMLVVQGGGNPA